MVGKSSDRDYYWIAKVLGISTEKVRDIEKSAINKIRARSLKDRAYRAKLYACLELACELGASEVGGANFAFRDMFKI